MNIIVCGLLGAAVGLIGLMLNWPLLAVCIVSAVVGVAFALLSN